MRTIIRDVISVRDFSLDYILDVTERAQNIYAEIKSGDDRNYKHKLEGYEASEIFGEVSTRTHGSTFKALTAMGAAHPYGISDPDSSSLKKGESIADTVDTFTGYGTNILVIRDSREGSARWARISALRSYSRRIRAFAQKCYQFPSNQSLPLIISGGDGPRNHPTQFLLDCSTMQHHFGRCQDLKIGYINDPASRVFASHADAAAILGWKLFSYTPEGVDLKKRTLSRISDTGAEFKEFHDFGEFMRIFKDLDVLYVNRYQKNFRTQAQLQNESAKVKTNSITLDLLKDSGFKSDSIVMHARPIDKNEKEIDDSLRYHAWNVSGIQSDFGVPTRMAILDYALSHRVLTSLEGIIKSLSPEDFAYVKQDRSNDPIKEKPATDYTTAYVHKGYIIDHIPLGCGAKMAETLKQILPRGVPVISSFDVKGGSGSSKNKDMIKIHGNVEWDYRMSNLVALFTDPSAKKSCRVSRFEDGKRIEKWAFRDYDESDSCVNWNPENEKCNCITSAQYKEGIKFKHVVRKDGLKECPYCDTIQ